MLHNAVPRCIANGMGFVLVGDPVQEVCPARRLARQALITLLMALALADAVLLGSFGPVDPLPHGNGLHVIDRPHDGLYRPVGRRARVPQVHCTTTLNRLYTNASQAPGGSAPRPYPHREPRSQPLTTERTDTMTDSDWAALDLPRLAPIEDPDAYLRAALRWHFGSDTGSPYWLARAKGLDFNPLTDVKSFADLTLFPNIVDELRDVPVEDLVPAGYGASPPLTIWESGGTTGAPKRVVAPLDWVQQLGMWLVEELDEPAIRGGGLLFVGPSGPHMFGQIQRYIANCMDARLFYIDLDPRWVKKLVARGAFDEMSSRTSSIWSHKPSTVLRSQDIRHPH